MAKRPTVTTSEPTAVTITPKGAVVEYSEEIGSRHTYVDGVAGLITPKNVLFASFYAERIRADFPGQFEASAATPGEVSVPVGDVNPLDGEGNLHIVRDVAAKLVFTEEALSTVIKSLTDKRDEIRRNKAAREHRSPPGD